MKRRMAAHRPSIIWDRLIFRRHSGSVDGAASAHRFVDHHYLFDGEIVHRDSVGSEQTIRPGEV
jgi:hypothetical protein